MTDFLLSRLRMRMKRGEPIASVTAYDYFTARLAAAADMDFVLVGDSLGNVIQGEPTTIGVTIDEMVYHTRIVARHFPRERVVLDLPFGPWLATTDGIVETAAGAFKAAGCGAVKLEGAGPEMVAAIEKLTVIGVPVLAHIGLQPQRVHAMGGFKRQGRTEEQSSRLLGEALAVENAGACAVVLELLQPELAAQISGELAIPTIGIGSGPDCDGQILVAHDVLGMLPDGSPSFAKRYAELFLTGVQAMRSYASAVRGHGTADSTLTVEPAAIYGAAAPEAALPPAPYRADADPDSHSQALLADLAGRLDPGARS